MENIEKENKYYRARIKVAAIKKFYLSVMSYVLIIGGLAALNYWVNQWQHPWFLWAALGWGIGLVFHAMKVYEVTPFFGKNWEERKIKELIKKGDSKSEWK